MYLLMYKENAVCQPVLNITKINLILKCKQESNDKQTNPTSKEKHSRNQWNK